MCVYAVCIFQRNSNLIITLFITQKQPVTEKDWLVFLPHPLITYSCPLYTSVLGSLVISLPLSNPYIRGQKWINGDAISGDRVLWSIQLWQFGWGYGKRIHKGTAGEEWNMKSEKSRARPQHLMILCQPGPPFLEWTEDGHTPALVLKLAWKQTVGLIIHQYIWSDLYLRSQPSCSIFISQTSHPRRLHFNHWHVFWTFTKWSVLPIKNHTFTKSEMTSNQNN